MSFEKNQISRLYIWVHPDYTVIKDYTQRKSEIFIESLATEPSQAVLEIPFYLRPRTKDQLDNNIITNKNNPKYWVSLQRFEKTETRALDLLRDRFLIWPFRELVEGNNSNHLDFLRKYYNTKKRSIGGYPEPVLFEEIYVFGQMPNSCVAHQARESRLHEISNEVDWGSELPKINPTNYKTIKRLSKIDKDWNDPKTLKSWKKLLTANQL
jgi:hypothetical protein